MGWDAPGPHCPPPGATFHLYLGTRHPGTKSIFLLEVCPTIVVCVSAAVSTAFPGAVAVAPPQPLIDIPTLHCACTVTTGADALALGDIHCLPLSVASFLQTADACTQLTQLFHARHLSLFQLSCLSIVPSLT